MPLLNTFNENAAFGIYKRYSQLNTKKQNKIDLMERVQRYLAPKDQHLIRGEDEEDVLFDVKGARKLKSKSTSSIAGLINAFSNWVVFSPVTNDEEKKKAIMEWSRTANDEFKKIINDSRYPKNVFKDKFYYDLFGFSGMTFSYLSEDGRINSEVENPFSLVYSRNSRGEVSETYFQKDYDPSEAEAIFGKLSDEFYIQVEGKEKLAQQKVRVLTAFLKNKEEFFNEVEDKNKRKAYVQVSFAVKAISLSATDTTHLNSIASGGFEQIGEPKFFNYPLTAVVTDVLAGETDYGEGEGKLLLPTAQNVNKLKRDLKLTSAFLSNPPIATPIDVIDDYNNITPGMNLPKSNLGDPEILQLSVNPQHQLSILQHEELSLEQQLPLSDGNSPFDKKQRQSQFQVAEGLAEQRLVSLAMNINYITEGILAHVRVLFRLAIDSKLLSLPDGIKIKDVEPNLDSLLEKEYRKEKAKTTAETLGLLQAHFQAAPYTIDNIDWDTSLREICIGLDQGSLLVSIEDRTKTRQERQQQEQQQQQQQLQQQQELATAEAYEKTSKGQLNEAKADEAQQI